MSINSTPLEGMGRIVTGRCKNPAFLVADETPGQKNAAAGGIAKFQPR